MSELIKWKHKFVLNTILEYVCFIELLFQNRWSPTYDVAAILTSIQSLLDEPNPNSPANSHAAQLYQENRREYEKRVQQIVEQVTFIALETIARQWLTIRDELKGSDFLLSCASWNRLADDICTFGDLYFPESLLFHRS